MQQEGYFDKHAHYADYFGAALTEEEKALDRHVLALDFKGDRVEFPMGYSEALERSVKRTEHDWLPRMFNLPTHGAALDLGCGFGRSLAWMAQVYDTVVGCDISASLIEKTREKFAATEHVSLYVNGADTLPVELGEQLFSVIYCFTVFQHIPRPFTQTLLSDCANRLSADGCVVFNLLTGINDAVDQGEEHTEWAIGYTRQQADALLHACNLKADRIVQWYASDTAAGWLWIQASRCHGSHLPDS
ncbi:MAG: class I SAM-dependent methyltransferase [Pseudomonadales bacterium]|nr:class I SAM-dependent methyltransferase [Pseudomonadales bacterium]